MGEKDFFVCFLFICFFSGGEKEENNGQMKTQSLGGEEPRLIHASRRDKSQTPKWKWNYSWRGVGGMKKKKREKKRKTLVLKRWRHVAFSHRWAGSSASILVTWDSSPEGR